MSELYSIKGDLSTAEVVACDERTDAVGKSVSEQHRLGLADIHPTAMR